MQRIGFRKIIIFILFLLFSISVVHGRLNVADIKCSELGVLSFKMGYTCTKGEYKCTDESVKRIRDVNIATKSGDKEYIIQSDDPPRYIKEQVTYVSKDDILDGGKKYTLFVDDKEQQTNHTFSCPEIKYRCSKIDLKVDLCSEKGINYYYLFHGLSNQFDRAELSNEIDYFVNPTMSSSGFYKSEDLPTSSQIKEIGQDYYILTVPSTELKNKGLKDILIEVKDCDNSAYTSSAYNKCEKTDCTADSSCPFGSYCDKNEKICKILVCNSCETLSAHSCVPKCQPRQECENAICQNGLCRYSLKSDCCKANSDCDDTNACTIDTCTDTKCTHKGVECKASDDPCVVGVCENPNGCKYIRNPECESIKNSFNLLNLINDNQAESQSIEGDNLYSLLGFEFPIKVISISNETVELSVNSKSYIAELENVVPVDIDKDGKYDFGVTLTSIDKGIPKFRFSRVTQLETKQDNKSQPPVVYGIGIAILLILVFFIIFIIVKLNKKEEKKTDININIKAETLSNEAISISNFTLRSGNHLILDNISFSVSRGSMVCLLGPSGSGKSTIIEALVGRKNLTKGTIKIFGIDITKEKDIYTKIGFVPQNSELYYNQTVYQNLYNSATKWGIKDAEKRIENILTKIGLSDRKDVKSSNLSGGQQKLLSIGMELIRDIEVCILDEPTSGLDPNTRNNIITILSHINSQLHKTIFFTTHYMEDAEECDDVIIFAEGQIVAQGRPDKLEKSIPGGGRIVNIVLDNITNDILSKIKKIDGVVKVISQGRDLRILSENPSAVKIGQQIEEFGGIVNETKIDNATMMEVFVYYTGKNPK